ncbi:T9SS type A sorting domain-containing protein [Dyadobacter sp. LHD-138]|uniref:T9SS type A sorting domain-containing protein n=1 Tax=Dyadobacter sp. LHD-138 TaxID=3071413 RepID=UPI0027E1A9F9|nr:T9SS type A sorting domain-containing protein [Dyadobacter sp. LHD-138]MDQ6480629.1 T9SS type A sorting domain-containing protein [Dyadobacter sp. LHD-138]
MHVHLINPFMDSLRERLHKLLSPIIFVLSLFFVCLLTGKSYAQDCLPVDGGIEDISIPGVTGHKTYYPGATSGTDRIAKATAGQIYFYYGNTTSNLALRHFTIRPELGGKTGSVVLTFNNIALANDGIIKIYNSSNNTGTVAMTINAANDQDIVGTELVLKGDVTISFQGSIVPTTQQHDPIDIRYVTGDQVFTTCRDRSSAVWKAFVTPNSYLAVDDMHLTSTPGENHAPICVAYFDENKNFTTSEIGFCLNSHKDVSSPSWGYYYGQTPFTYKANDSFDIDESGAYNSTDQLKTARIMWLLKNSPTGTAIERINGQIAIWRTLDNPINYGHVAGSLARQAQLAVPSLPTPPEPTFSITAQNSPASPGQYVNFQIAFQMASPNPQRLKLSIPADAEFGTVTGGTYDAGTGFLTITSSPVTVQVKRNTSGVAKLTAVYEEDNFWNIHNLKVYNSCDPAVQSFVGLGRKDIVYPFREASAEWGFSLSGNLYHDSNGLNDAGGGRVNNTVLAGGDATGFNPNGNLFVHLYEVSSQPVYFGTQQLDANGFFKFTSVGTGTYRAVMTNGTIDDVSSIPASSLPEGWLNTGEVFGAPVSVGADGLVNGMNTGSGANGIVLNNADVINVNFGIQTPPVSHDYTFVIDQPSGGSKVVLNSSLVVSGSGHTAPSQLTGTDLEDVNNAANGYLGSCNRTIIIQTPIVVNSGTGSPKLYYDYDGAGGSDPVLLNLGSVAVPTPVRIVNYCQDNLSIVLDGSGYNGVSFTYSFVDAASAVSVPTNYIISWNTALPVVLTRFNVAKSEGAAKLSWTTTSETNSERFDIEHSLTGKEWDVMGSVSAGKESAVSVNYSFTHEKTADGKALNGQNFYRLKMIDLDQTFTYSRIQSLQFPKKAVTVSVYPNPVSDVLFIKDVALESIKSIMINDLNGKIIYEANSIKNEGIPVKNLVSGMYLLQISQMDGTRSSHKVIISR